jgi:hypothetical protein
LTGVPERIQSRILALKQPRTLHNEEDKGPDPRGRKRGLKRSDTAAIAVYLDDSDLSLNDKRAPWQDIAEVVGINLLQTTHFKPPGLRTIDIRLIRHACWKMKV